MSRYGDVHCIACGVDLADVPCEDIEIHVPWCITTKRYEETLDE